MAHQCPQAYLTDRIILQDSEEDEDGSTGPQSPIPSTGTRSPTPKAISPRTHHPKIIREEQIWNYSWRSKKEGESVNCLSSDDELFEITFGGPIGNKITGTFGGDCVSNCVFAGAKASEEKAAIDISDEWAGYNDNVCIPWPGIMLQVIDYEDPTNMSLGLQRRAS